jgi:hypothetical protein
MDKEEWVSPNRSAIRPSTYVEISANHTGLGSDILLYSFVEIRDNHTGLGSVILHGQYVDISAKHV